MKSNEANKITAAYLNSAALAVLTAGCIAPAVTRLAVSGGNVLVLTLAGLAVSLALHWWARRLVASGDDRQR